MFVTVSTQYSVITGAYFNIEMYTDVVWPVFYSYREICSGSNLVKIVSETMILHCYYSYFLRL